MASTSEESAMSDFSDNYRRNLDEYSYRLPTPPRIAVPPPILTTNLPTLRMSLRVADEANMDFLKEVDLTDVLQKNSLLEWTYEQRRRAQMVLPWLYLGPMVAARDTAFLQRKGITMVLAIQSKGNSMMGAVQAAGTACLKVATIEAPDFYHLIAKFSDAASIINNHIALVRQEALEKTGQPVLGKVLIFCESGNEKSAAVAAAYLMQIMHDFDYVKAIQVCQAQRFSVNFDDTIKHTLRSYWDILLARRSVATYTPSPSGPQFQTIPTMARKRSIDHARDDEDVNMDEVLEESDMLRFLGRDAIPFHDS